MATLQERITFMQAAMHRNDEQIDAAVQMLTWLRDGMSMDEAARRGMELYRQLRKELTQ